MSLHHNYIQNYQHQQQQQQQRPPHQLRTSIAFLSSQTNDTPDHDTTATPTTPLTPASASAPTSDSAPPAPALSLTFDQTKDRNKNRKRKTIRACNHCQKSHLTCDENRPCTRCIKRGLASTCIDGVRKKAKYLLDIKEEPEENAGGEHGEETEEPGGVVVTAGPKPLIIASMIGDEGQVFPDFSKDHQQQQQQQQQQNYQNQRMQTMSHMAPFSQSTQSQGLTLAVPALTSGPGATIQGNSVVNQAAASSSSNSKNTSSNNNNNNNSSSSNGITIDTPISNADTIASGGLPPAASLGGPANALRMTPTSASFESEAINLEYAFLSSMLSYPMLANPSGLSTSTENAGFGAGSTISIPNSLWAAPPPPPQQTQLPPLIPSQSHLVQPQNHHNNHQLGSVAHMMHRQESWQNHQPLMHHDNNNNMHAAPANIYPHQHAMSTLAKASPPPHAQIVTDDTHYPLSRPPTTGPAVYGLNPVYPQSPAEVYSSVTEPYKYYNGFHYFFRHICGRMDKKNIIRVSRAIAHFRPSLVALLRNLTHDDLIFMEKSFQRALMEYEKLIGFIGTPTVVWRRSGEIALVGKEFSILTQWDRQQLVSGNKFIFELMDTTSAVVYWEQFAVHAFENSEHAVMSECRLVRPDGVAVPCAFSFTIKRDLFGIPMAIIGNFLPIL